MIILTGAGISADSGLSTFRDAEGFWARFDWQRLATPEAFADTPDDVHAFYNARRAQLRAVTPNPAHRALAALEKALPPDIPFLLISQNVDNLHQTAGSQVLPMHGQLNRIRCTACGDRRDHEGDLTRHDKCSACGAVGTLRPDIVWFGEVPHGLRTIEAAMGHVTEFVAIGTSGSVYPAAGLAAAARAAGARTTELNLVPSDNAHAFDESDYGPAAEIVPRWAAAYLTKIGVPLPAILGE